MGKLYLTTGDYIKNAKGMDAIVDAQNKYMDVGGNICGLILNAAGRQELLNYCKEHFKKEMYPSEIRVTQGFNLNMDIIHVLAPIYKDEEHPLEMIRKTYINLTNTIKEKNYKNVIICSLGTGSHGYNPDDIAYDVIKILSDFADNNDVNLYFNNMYPLMKDIYLKELIKIKKIDINSIENMSKSQLKDFFDKYNLYDININEKYDDFISGRSYNDLCISEKLLFKESEIKNS